MGSSPHQPRDVRERFGALYDDLCTIATAMLRTRRGEIVPTELVHEAFVALQREERVRAAQHRSRLGGKPDSVFKACFGAACRDVLADRTRRRNAKKRGGDVDHKAASSSITFAGTGPVEAAVINDALAALERFDPLAARIVEQRVFAEMSIAECAEALAVSASTVDRHWRFAKAWLIRRIT